MEHVDRLLEEPCYVVDFLPKRVSKETNGQFFEVENYLLNQYKILGMQAVYYAEC